MIIPRINDIIKHERFMDLAFLVQKPAIISKTGKLKLRGLWVNQGFVETQIIDHNRKRLTIMPDDIDKWLVCLDPHLKCVRDAKWRKLK